MIDHLSLRVTDIPKSIALYTALLEPLGYEKVMEYGDFIGFGPKGKPIFWLTKSDKIVPTHVAFVARDKDAVDNFYKAALAAGAKDNGPPGLRKEYHPGYYAAFVLDLDGNNLEAVIHTAAK